MKDVLWLLLATGVLFACGERRSRISAGNTVSDPLLAARDFYFTGEYVYYAGNAILTDCVTGKTFSIVPKADYLNAERDYSTLSASGPEPCFATLKGYIIPAGTDSEEQLQELVITSFGQFDTTHCATRTRQLTGSYRNAGESCILEIDDDYTYTWITRDPEGREKVAQGRWGRISESVLVFVFRDGQDQLATVDWENLELVFSENSTFVKRI